MQLITKREVFMKEGKILWALTAALRAAADELEHQANLASIGLEDPFIDWLSKMIKGRFTPRSILWKLWPDKSIGRTHFYRHVEKVLGKPVRKNGSWGWIL